MKLPPGADNLLKLMNCGHSLFLGTFGPWTQHPIDNRCSNANIRSVRALLNRRLIAPGPTPQLVLTPKGGRVLQAMNRAEPKHDKREARGGGPRGSTSVTAPSATKTTSATSGPSSVRTARTS